MSAQGETKAGHWRRFRVLYAVLAVTLAPLLASYVAYYIVPPKGRTNYGTLIEPQRPVPLIAATGIDGSAFDLRALKGKWVLLMVDNGACDSYCESKLFHMRQLRTMAGKDMDDIERVWFITDREPLSTVLLREFEGTYFVRADQRALLEFLQRPDDSKARLADHIWLIDPAGNEMLRWPRNPDPSGTRSDLARLLKAAGIWTRVERKP